MKNLIQNNQVGYDLSLIAQDGKAGQDAEHHLLEDFFELYVKVLDDSQDLQEVLPKHLHQVEKFSSEEALLIAVSG